MTIHIETLQKLIEALKRQGLSDADIVKVLTIMTK